MYPESYCFFPCFSLFITQNPFVLHDLHVSQLCDSQIDIWTFQFCGHAPHDSPVFKDMSPDAVFITSMRDPAMQVMSAFKFYYPNAKMKIGEILNLDEVKMGMVYVKVPPKYLTNRNETERFIRQNLDKFFQLVLIKEYLDESLVFLRRKFCWDFEDILYSSLKVSTKKTNLPEEDADSIRAKMVSESFFSGFSCNFHEEKQQLTKHHQPTHTSKENKVELTEWFRDKLVKFTVFCLSCHGKNTFGLYLWPRHQVTHCLFHRLEIVQCSNISTNLCGSKWLRNQVTFGVKSNSTSRWFWTFRDFASLFTFCWCTKLPLFYHGWGAKTQPSSYPAHHGANPSQSPSLTACCLYCIISHSCE